MMNAREVRLVVDFSGTQRENARRVRVKAVPFRCDSPWLARADEIYPITHHRLSQSTLRGCGNTFCQNASQNILNFRTVIGAERKRRMQREYVGRIRIVEFVLVNGDPGGQQLAGLENSATEEHVTETGGQRLRRRRIVSERIRGQHALRIAAESRLHRRGEFLGAEGLAAQGSEQRALITIRAIDDGK